MSRVRMVTRTVKTKEVKFVGFNLDEMKPEDMSVTFGEDVKIQANNDGLATINNKLTKDGKHATAVMIKEITENETLYGMTEEDFLKYAKVLPPRTGNTEE